MTNDYRELTATITFGGNSDEEVLELARKQLDTLSDGVKDHVRYTWTQRATTYLFLEDE